MVMATLGNPDAVSVMDRELYAYQRGERPGGDPNQTELDALLARVTRVRGIASGMFRSRPLGTEVLCETSDPADLAAFRRLFPVIEDPATFSHCGCLGGPTLELFAGEILVATFGLQHGHSFRWAAWKHDAKLRDGAPLRRWLLDRGIEAEFLDVLFGNQYENGGMMQIGYRRPGPEPLTRTEQQFRLVELARVRGGDRAETLGRCEHLLRANPNSAFGYVVRSLFHQDAGNHAAMVADCTSAIDLGYRDAEVYFTRAVANDTLGKPEAALADCDAALALDAGHANALNSRGLIQSRLDHIDAALSDFAAAIRVAPGWYLPRVNRASVHLKRDDPAAAIVDYDAAIASFKNARSPQQQQMLAMVLWNRGQCHRKMGNTRQADADTRQAQELNRQIGNRANGSV